MTQWFDDPMTQSPNRGRSLTPAALGYRVPAEWEPHEATWIAWPHNRTDWPGKFEAIPWVYAEIVRHLAQVERVEIIVSDDAEEERSRRILSKSHVELSNVRFHRWPTDRVWTRDSGPIFVRRDASSGEKGKPAKEQVRRAGGYASPLALTHWRFNAWAKYPDWKRDCTLPARVAKVLKLPVWRPTVVLNGTRHEVVLEGGSIDVNGCGTLLTTEECLLSNVQQRNPGLSRADLEHVFGEYLGIKKVLWLEAGIVGDDTHGHVDDIARFVSPDTVVAVVEGNKEDQNFEILQNNLYRLQTMSDQDGRPLRVIPLPMPAPVIFRGQRLPASYANFYIANGLVLVPTFNDVNDRIALNSLAELFPKRQVVGIYCGDFIWGLGAIHCMTQQQPKSSG
jgi:agmatine deiminase